MNKYKYLLLIVSSLWILNPVLGQKESAFWNFESTVNKSTLDKISGSTDTIEGNTYVAQGVKGDGLRFDGFTSCIKTTGKDRVIQGSEISLEAWVSLGNYPWNWCPIISTISNENKGYRLLVGPLGQASLEVAINEQWITCSSGEEALPLRTWMHVVGVYSAHKELKLYINGKLVSTTSIQDQGRFPNSGYMIGMVTQAAKPSDIHRTWGTIEQYFGLDGILDEIKVYNQALTADQVQAKYSAISAGVPDIAPRHLPVIEKNPRRFGAYYTKLKYYPAWDDLWPVDQDPDIVVCFEESPIKLIFWRGIRYGASWVSENENWMSDQSVEAWENGEKDKEGCFEHMQDRHCRYSHVRIIENTDARVVIHWRYAPTSAYLNTWRVDPKTGWECWIDEYYYIYPDATAIRKVSWKTGTLGYPRQFQETLALLSPGQKVSDLLEKDFTRVADYEGNTDKQTFLDQPIKGGFDKSYDYTIQQYGFKSEHKPFICFEPGNKMFLRDGRLSGYDQASGCNHFPVGQARCDGRTTRVGDRPSHATSFPISDPVIHENGDRMFWNGLYGMNNKPLEELILFGRSWAYAPDIQTSGNYKSLGFDRSERCYQIEGLGLEASGLRITLEGKDKRPVNNPAFYIKNWNGEKPKVLVDGVEITSVRIGLKEELSGTDLIVYVPVKSQKTVQIQILP